MKIEKMNDAQIRCTLTSEDLALRKINLSELAYGTDKARSLFRELMNMAADEFNFEADDIPLMVEAVPVNKDCLVLTVTKVEDPEELDTRFAQFSPSLIEDENDEDSYESVDYSDDTDPELSGLFKQISAAKKDNSKENIDFPETTNQIRLFSFSSMNEVINCANILGIGTNCVSSLYKDTGNCKYLLFMEQNDLDLIDFKKICTIVSEYGKTEKNLLTVKAYLEEHCECIIASCAIDKLAQI